MLFNLLPQIPKIRGRTVHHFLDWDRDGSILGISVWGKCGRGGDVENQATSIMESPYPEKHFLRASSKVSCRRSPGIIWQNPFKTHSSPLHHSGGESWGSLAIPHDQIQPLVKKQILAPCIIMSPVWSLARYPLQPPTISTPHATSDGEGIQQVRPQGKTPAVGVQFWILFVSPLDLFLVRCPASA